MLRVVSDDDSRFTLETGHRYREDQAYNQHYPNVFDNEDRIPLTSNGNSASPPMLKRILSSRVLYAVSLPPTRRSTSRLWNWKYLTLLLVVVSLASLLFWFVLARHNQISATPRSDTPNSKDIFGVVFDAGSTGSRVNVFQLTVNESDVNKPYVLTDQLYSQTKPGLSAYADEPENAAKSLLPLIQVAQDRLPKGLCSRTPVLLRATAGLRLLSARKADNILTSVRSTLMKSCFLKPSDPVSILDGNLEGLYVWISLNSLLKHIPTPSSLASIGEFRFKPEDTVGTLDLGGGSTQITFAPKRLTTLTDAPPGFITSIQFGKPVFVKQEMQLGTQVYSYSYLGLGLMSARYSMLHTITRRLPSSRFGANSELYTPCFPHQNSTVSWSHADRNWTIKYLSINDWQPKDVLLPNEFKNALDVLGIIESADQKAPVVSICYALALSVLRDPVEGEPASPLYPPSGYVVHRPVNFSQYQFYAFSFLFDLAVSIGIVDGDLQTGKVTVGQFRDAAVRICQSPDTAKPFECMDLCFVTALLHDGYGFPWDKQLTLQKKINKFEISWSLGAFFAQLYSSRQF